MSKSSFTETECSNFYFSAETFAIAIFGRNTNHSALNYRSRWVFAILGSMKMISVVCTPTTYVLRRGIFAFVGNWDHAYVRQWNWNPEKQKKPVIELSSKTHDSLLYERILISIRICLFQRHHKTLWRSF